MLALFKLGHNVWINYGIYVIWAHHCRIYKVQGSFVLIRHISLHCNTTTKGCLVPIGTDAYCVL